MALVDDLVSWSITSSMRGQYGGTLVAVNVGRKYPSAWANNPIRAGISVSGDLYGCGSGAAVNWLNGVIDAPDEEYDPDAPNSEMSFGVGSFAARLGNKPVNTYQFDGMTANQVLAELVDTFGGLPSSLYSFALSSAQTFNKIIVQGDNLLEEARKVARAAGGDLYINHLGILTATDWKDNGDAVDVVIPQTAVLGASKSLATSQGVSRVKVRGRWLDNKEIPGVDGAPSPSSTQNKPPGGNKSPLGTGDTCICSATPVWKGEHKLNVRGKFNMGPNGMRNGELATSMMYGDISYMDEQPDGSMEATIRNTGPYGAWPAINNLNGYDAIPLQMTAYGDFDRDWQWPGRNNWIDKKGGRELIHKLAVKLEASGSGRGGGGRGGRGGGGGSGGGSTSKQTPRSQDEGEEIRVECTVNDSGLRNEFGVAIEEIDNPYVKTEASACSLGARRFAEFKMGRHPWTVRIAYMPCIELNQVVRFTIPGTSGTVTGLVTELTVNYSADPISADMELVVESFEDL